jgi:hypothetical protein
MPQADGAKIVDFAKSKALTMVGTGECYELADAAIKDQGGKSASHYGEITDDADYVWGKDIAIGAAAPGDILQYRNFVATRTVNSLVKLTLDGGDSIEYSRKTVATFSRPHHTSVVTGGVSGNQISVLEQNVDRGSGVMEKTVGAGKHYVKPASPPKSKSDEEITINADWAAAVKAINPDAGFMLFVDQILAKYNGKTFTGKLENSESVEISGTVKAYRVQK